MGNICIKKVTEELSSKESIKDVVKIDDPVKEISSKEYIVKVDDPTKKIKEISSIIEDRNAEIIKLIKLVKERHDYFIDISKNLMSKKDSEWFEEIINSTSDIYEWDKRRPELDKNVINYLKDKHWLNLM